jgi:hypothetical protein
MVLDGSRIEAQFRFDDVLVRLISDQLLVILSFTTDSTQWESTGATKIKGRVLGEDSRFSFDHTEGGVGSCSLGCNPGPYGIFVVGGYLDAYLKDDFFGVNLGFDLPSEGHTITGAHLDLYTNSHWAKAWVGTPAQLPEPATGKLFLLALPLLLFFRRL